MLWQVLDTGHTEVRLRAEGAEIYVLRAQAEELIADIIRDLMTTLGIEVLRDEIRASFSKVRPEVTVTWRTTVPKEHVEDVRTYLTGVAEGLQ